MDLFKNRVITKVDWIIIGASLFLLLIISVAYFLGIGLLKNRVDSLNAEVAKTQAQLTETRKIAARKDGLLRELKEVRARISKFEETLPTDKEVPKLLSQFQRIAELSGVKYKLITAEPIDEKETYVRIPFKVNVNGKYPQIGKFLRSLEFGNRFIKVEDVQIGPEEKGRSEAKFIISTYMFVNREKPSESGVTQS
jgi:Tfp pilus assembly protein PilO